MTTQNGFRSHILQLIAGERAKRAELVASIQKQLDDLDENIIALERTLRLYDASNGSTPKQLAFTVSPDMVSKNARTQAEALKYIAKASRNCVIHYVEARDIIVAAGMTEGKARNVASHLYHIMNRSDEWERVAPGRFRLVRD